MRIVFGDCPSERGRTPESKNPYCGATIRVSYRRVKLELRRAGRGQRFADAGGLRFGRSSSLRMTELNLSTLPDMELPQSTPLASAIGAFAIMQKGETYPQVGCALGTEAQQQRNSSPRDASAALAIVFRVEVLTGAPSRPRGFDAADRASAHAKEVRSGFAARHVAHHRQSHAT